MGVTGSHIHKLCEILTSRIARGDGMLFSFQHEINNGLWDAISQNYNSENYTSAILDAVFYISEMIRERTDVELDGVALVGKVFGGNDPLLKVTKMRTETEKNQQRGIESLLRGVFQAIRNPRAHEKIVDDKKTCDYLLGLFSYLADIIEASKARFDFGDYCKRIFDPDFVESEQYADLLVAEVPEKKLFEVILSLFQRREDADPAKFQYVVRSFLKRLTKSQTVEFMSYCSEILKTSNDDHDFRVFTRVFQDELWPSIELAARLRAENKLIKSFEKGRYDSQKERCASGALGTWLSNILDSMQLKDQFKYTLTKKLFSEDYEELEYVFRFFRNSIIRYDEEPDHALINAINKGLKRGDKRFYDLVSVEMTIAPRGWTRKIEANYNNFEGKDLYPDSYEDDTPF